MSLRFTAMNDFGNSTLCEKVSKKENDTPLWKFHLRIKFCFQRLDHLFPVLVGSKTASRCTADGVSGIELHVEWIESVATRADRNPDRIGVWVDLILTVQRLVELEADLRQVVELWNSTASNLGLNATL